MHTISTTQLYQVHCTLEPGVVLVASKGQPMSIAFDHDTPLVLFASEAEALNVSVRESGASNVVLRVFFDDVVSYFETRSPVGQILHFLFFIVNYSSHRWRYITHLTQETYLTVYTIVSSIAHCLPGKSLPYRIDLDGHGEIVRVGEPRALLEGRFRDKEERAADGHKGTGDGSGSGESKDGKSGEQAKGKSGAGKRVIVFSQ